MSSENWFDIISRLTESEPLVLDEQSASPDLPSVDYEDHSKLIQGDLPSSIFGKSNPEAIALGIRVTEPIDNVAAVALHLATLACERNIQPVVISTIDMTGFEQFGFRVERIEKNNAKEAAIQEKELKQFWNIAVIVDLEDVLLMA